MASTNLFKGEEQSTALAFLRRLKKQLFESDEER